MGQPVVHLEVVGQDADMLRNYYSQLFGWKFSEPMGPTNYTVLEDQEGIGGGFGSAPDGYPGHVTFYVQVPDVGATLEEAESLGGSRMMGPDEVPGAGIVIGLFTDPEGRTIGVMSPVS